LNWNAFLFVMRYLQKIEKCGHLFPASFRNRRSYVRDPPGVDFIKIDVNCNFWWQKAINAMFTYTFDSFYVLSIRFDPNNLQLKKPLNVNKKVISGLLRNRRCGAVIASAGLESHQSIHMYLRIWRKCCSAAVLNWLDMHCRRDLFYLWNFCVGKKVFVSDIHFLKKLSPKVFWSTLSFVTK
jgi:hypothetical protein